MTVQELAELLLEQEDGDMEVKLRVEGQDFTILDFLEEWRGSFYLFALEAGK